MAKRSKGWKPPLPVPVPSKLYRFELATGGFVISTCALLAIAGIVMRPTQKPGDAA